MDAEGLYSLDLLLLADPSEEFIYAYLDKGDCYVALIDSEVVGVFVLQVTGENVMELMNIAVAELYQGQCIGKQLLQHVIRITSECGATMLEVGTGNSSIGQLALYQKSGFKIVGVDVDYFVRNYREPIFENGIQCRDMIRLSLNILGG